METFNPKAETGVASKETQETAELKKNFAKELRKSEEGSFLKKLKRIGGALALAGLSVITPKDAIAPETTEEYRIAKSGRDLEKESLKNMPLFKRVDKALEETGGIKVSPQLETTYKVMPEIAKMLAMGKMANGEIPYFSKPEVILGQEFIYKNPKEAREYMDKIRKTMQATVIVMAGEEIVGSGTIIDAGDQRVVVTNEHVAAGDKGDYSFITSDGKQFKTRTIYTNNKKDLAVLESGEDLEQAVKSKSVSALKLASVGTQKDLQTGNKLASVGHPLKFPFEVALSEYTGNMQPQSIVVNQVGEKINNAEFILSRQDKRFSNLQTYPITNKNKIEGKKGDILGGMSGGPVILLDKAGEPEIIGINAINIYSKETDYTLIGGSISADDIRTEIEQFKTAQKRSTSK